MALTHLFIVTDGVEEGYRAKRPRAPSVSEIVPDQELEERNGPPKGQQNTVPPGFLSPSVREYLELGKSIPGKQNVTIQETLSLARHVLTDIVYKQCTGEVQQHRIILLQITKVHCHTLNSSIPVSIRIIYARFVTQDATCTETTEQFRYVIGHKIYLVLKFLFFSFPGEIAIYQWFH